MTNHTNAQVNALCAAVPGPYGPLTRVTDLLTLPNDNSNMLLEFTDTRGTRMYMRYAELADVDARTKIIAEAEGINYMAHHIITEVDDINDDLQALLLVAGGPYTPETFRTIVNSLKRIKNLSSYAWV